MLHEEAAEALAALDSCSPALANELVQPLVSLASSETGSGQTGCFTCAVVSTAACKPLPQWLASI